MTQCLLLINLFLLARIVTFTGDKRTQTGILVACGVFQLTAVAILSDSVAGVLIMGATVAVTSALLIATEASERRRELSRFATLLILAGVCSTFYHSGGGMLANALAPIHAWLKCEPEFAGWYARMTWIRTEIYLCGTLLCLDEANIATRLLLRFLNICPPDIHAITAPTPGQEVTTTTPAGPASLSDYQHGSIVGSFERVLVFIFVVNNAFNAVGFIITAKGLVKLRRLKNEDASEYILIGTLASTGVAIAIGLWAVQWAK